MTIQNSRRQIKFQYQAQQRFSTLSQHKQNFYEHKETKTLSETLDKVVMAVHREMIPFATIAAEKGALPEIANFKRINVIYVIDAAMLKQTVEPKRASNMRLHLSQKSRISSEVMVEQLWHSTASQHPMESGSVTVVHPITVHMT